MQGFKNLILEQKNIPVDHCLYPHLLSDFSDIERFLELLTLCLHGVPTKGLINLIIVLYMMLCMVLYTALCMVSMRAKWLINFIMVLCRVLCKVLCKVLCTVLCMVLCMVLYMVLCKVLCRVLCIELCIMHGVVHCVVYCEHEGKVVDQPYHGVVHGLQVNHGVQLLRNKR